MVNEADLVNKYDVLIVNKSGMDLPEYQTSGSAGIDLKAANFKKCFNCKTFPDHVMMAPGGRILIGTGLHFKIPEGVVGDIRTRSGLCINKGLIVLNSPGTIDSDYTDEVGIIIYNSSDTTQKIKLGERIAQMVFIPYIKASLKEVHDLKTTSRKGGFGSTGV